jgi:RNA polymerase sigma-70 factor (ECF subfamily)
MKPRALAAEIPPEDGDEQLLIKAAQADPRRFADLYERHFDRVYAFVARRAADRGEAEDVTSQVFHDALANLGRFEWRGAPFAAWLLRIARNALADRRQRAAREDARPPVGGEPEDHGQVDRRAMLSELVGQLPPDQQRVLAARFIQQKSIREIAVELRRTEGAVKQLQFRALETLRTKMRNAHE